MNTNLILNILETLIQNKPVKIMYMIDEQDIVHNINFLQKDKNNSNYVDIYKKVLDEGILFKKEGLYPVYAYYNLDIETLHCTTMEKIYNILN